MKAQALSNADKQSYMKARKTFELNARHPLVIALDKALAAGEKDSSKAYGYALFNAALISSGFQIEDTAAFAKNVYGLLSGSLGVEKDAKLSAEYELPAEEPKKEEAPKADAK